MLVAFRTALDGLALGRCHHLVVETLAAVDLPANTAMVAALQQRKFRVASLFQPTTMKCRVTTLSSTLTP